jgi:hypothetical protein
MPNRRRPKWHVRPTAAGMLPLPIADLVERLAAVSRQLLGLKDAHEAEAGAALAGAEPARKTGPTVGAPGGVLADTVPGGQQPRVMRPR